MRSQRSHGSMHMRAKTKSVIPQVRGPIEGGPSSLPDALDEEDAPSSLPASAALRSAPQSILPHVRAADRRPGTAGFAETDPLAALPEPECGGTARQTGPDIQGLLQIYDLGIAPAAAAGPDGFRWLAKRIVTDARFEVTFSILVMVNILITAIEVDHRHLAPSVFNRFNVVFAIIFTLELIARIYGMRKCDGLLLFDVFIVTVTVFEVILLDHISQQDAVELDLSYLLALRIFRLVRVLRIAQFMQSMEVLSVLTDAVCKSLQPLAFILLLLFLLLFALAHVLTTLMPLVVSEGDGHMDDLLLRQYGSIGRSLTALLEASAGVDEWGPEILLPLLSSARPWSAIFAVAMIIAVMAMSLGAMGLVAGIFLDQLLGASQSHDERKWEAQVAQHQGLLQQLDTLFMEMGYDSGDQVSWADLSQALKQGREVLQSLGISLDVAEQLFRHLDADGDGFVEADAFVFGVFKLRTISKSVDMLSIDYQQEKALRRVAELQASVRLAFSDVRARLSPLLLLLPQLRDRVARLAADLEDLRALQVRFLERHQQLRRRGSEERMSVSPAMLKLEYGLSRKLEIVEGAHQHSEGHVARDKAIDTLAGDVIRRVRDMLENELGELRESARSALPV